MGLKFFDAKLYFIELKAISEIYSSFGVETAFFENCLASLLKILLRGVLKISQFSAATGLLPKMRCQIYPKEFLKLVSYPASYCDRKVCL